MSFQLNEIKDNVKCKTCIREQLKGTQVLRTLWKHQHKRSYKKCVNRESVDDEVPKLRHGVLLANDPPFPSVAVVLDDNFILVFDLVAVVLILSAEFESLEDENSFGFFPKFLDSVLLLHRRHLREGDVQFILHF